MKIAKKLKELGVASLIGVVRGLISLRYRLKVTGLELLSSKELKEGSSGILFLPNHPAELDPVVLMLFLWKRFEPRPLVVEHFYYLKGVRFFMKLVGAIPLPTMNGGANQWKMHQIEKMQQKLVEGLKKGDHYLIYPAGRLKHGSEEMIGGASLTHTLVTACSEAKLVLIRTRGFWGSRFSRAITGSSPDFGKNLWEGFKVVLKNLIFFTPRRLLEIEFVLPPSDFPFKAQRIDFNHYLERWYNTPLDTLNLVSYSCWKPEFLEPFVKKELPSAAPVNVPEEVKTEIIAKVAKLARRPASQIKTETHLSQDLGLDSLDLSELSVFLDERYEVTDLSPEQIHTVGDLLQAAVRGKTKSEETRAPAQEEKIKLWLSEKNRPDPFPPAGKTIPEAFLYCADRMGNHIACGDVVSGILSYRRLKMAVLLFAKQALQMQGKYIGVLLPSSVGAYLVILAILLAKKVPVMLNWTVGRRSLDHACDLTELNSVISSYRFLSRLENVDLGKVEEKLVYLEDIRHKISWKDKIRALYQSRFSAKRLLEEWGLKEIKGEDPAVILFTSGTETLPKAVPLSHSNLLINQRAALSFISFLASDSMYSVLPPFHSFGFSVTGMLPLLIGLKAFYAPDPTDSHALAHDIATWKLSLFCCAPSFISALFRVASFEKLSSLRLIVAGAEKAQEELVQKIREMDRGTQFLEGYGITECAPIVTADRPGEPKRGVGKPLPGIELLLIDPETQKPISNPTTEEGEICIRGPNVFKGYLGGIPAPFITIDGKEWYRSGDRGTIDAEGNLLLSGRLKRFVKIGGEMVSLGGLESELLKMAQEKQWQQTALEGPPLAVSVKEKSNEKPQIVLFTTFDVSKEDINALLKGSGYGRLIKIDEVRRIEQIPLTGTGKTHYRLLDDMG